MNTDFSRNHPTASRRWVNWRGIHAQRHWFVNPLCSLPSIQDFLSQVVMDEPCLYYLIRRVGYRATISTHNSSYLCFVRSQRSCIPSLIISTNNRLVRFRHFFRRRTIKTLYAKETFYILYIFLQPYCTYFHRFHLKEFAGVRSCP